MVSKFLRQTVGEEEKGEKKRKERKEKRRKEKTFRAKGSKVRCDYFFLLLQALQVIYKWNQERGAKENQEQVSFNGVKVGF